MAAKKQPNQRPQTNKEEVEAYIDAVLRGKIVTGKLERAAVQRHRDDLKNARRKGIYFDEAAADRAIDFARMLKHSAGEWAGQPFELMPFQKFIFWCLFGWRRSSDGMRRFLRAFISLGSGNGKSPLAAIILILCTFFDWPPEPRAEGYIVATKIKQCGPVFDDVKAFRAQDPNLQQITTALKDVVTCPLTDSKIVKMGSEGTVDDGVRPHAVVYDEIHRARERHRETLEMMKAKLGKRRQPLMLSITTAGDDNSILWEEEYDIARKVVERGNSIEAVDLFVFICQIDDDDDPLDERNWPKANPMLAHGVVKITQLRSDANLARIDRRKKKEFTRLRMNRKVSSDVKPITSELWATGNLPLPELDGLTAHSAMDLGWKDDLAAVAYMFPLTPIEVEITVDGEKQLVKKRRCAVLLDCWIPDGTGRNLAEEPWATWIEKGWLTRTSGPVTDHEVIYARIAERQQQFSIASMAMDPNNARAPGIHIETNLGIPSFWFGQTCGKYNEPTRELLDMLREGRLIHGGNPLLAWFALNLVLKQDYREYVMPNKRQAKDKIDGAVAMIMALSEVMFAERAPALNYYETHDLEAG